MKGGITCFCTQVFSKYVKNREEIEPTAGSTGGLVQSPMVYLTYEPIHVPL